MTTIQENIKQYRESCEHMEKRINELNRKIAQSSPCAASAEMSQRRMRLYYQLWDMSHALQSLEEYQSAVQEKRMGESSYKS